MDKADIIKELRESIGMNRREFCDYFDIPYRTVTEWERDMRHAPDYVVRLLEYYIRMTTNNKSRNVSVIKDANGNNIVVINDILFKGRRGINWEDVEEYLRNYVGDFYSIAESDEVVFIGPDLPDEYAHSEYTRVLKGANEKAKANAVQGIPELINTASNKTYKENTKSKHHKDAMYGWYKYESRFALPIFGSDGEVERYNVFHAAMIIRHAQDGKKYLYDVVNIKKETGNLFRS